MTTATDLSLLLKQQQYPEFIQQLRDAVVADRSILTESEIKQWCGRRWRNLFITAAAADEAAVKTASKTGLLGKNNDNRPVRERVAQRFIRSDSNVEWQDDLPPAAMPKLQNHTLLFAPGLINGILPSRAFAQALPELEAENGWTVLRADLHPLRGCEANIVDMENALLRGQGLKADASQRTDTTAAIPGKVVIVGYSKGASDALEMLARAPELAKKVTAVFSWAGAVGGSFLADDIYNSIKDMSVDNASPAVASLLKVINPLVQLGKPVKRMGEANIKEAVRSLTTTERNAFYAEHGAVIDALNIPIFSLTGSTTVMEAPTFQMQGVMELNKYDSNNDMQVTQAQAKWPGSMGIDLCCLRGHHWDLSYSAFPRAMRMGSPNLDHPFPKKAAMLAMMQLVGELGLID